MVALTTQQAAGLTGKNRSTIWRAIKSGKISATKAEAGDFLIEPAELERVFGSLQPRTEVRNDAMHPRATSNETSSLRVEVTLLREQVGSLQADKSDLRAERDRLLGVIEMQAEQVRLLTDQRAEPEPIEVPPRRRRWWRWALFLV